jgi:hypothetical protein
MQLIAPGQPQVQPRLKFEQLYSLTSPAKPLREKRLRIISETAVRGVPVHVGSVLSFDVSLPDYHEDFGLLRSCLRGEIVSNDTPLFLAPAPDVTAKRK